MSYRKHLNNKFHIKFYSIKITFILHFCRKGRYNCQVMDVGRLTVVGQRPMKSLASVCLSVRPSRDFLKIGSLVFSDIVHDDS